MKLRLKKRQLGHFNISQPAVAHFPLSVFQRFLQYRLTQARTIVFLLLTSAELHPEKPVNVHLYWFVTCFSFLTPANDSHLPTCFSTSNLNLMLTNQETNGQSDSEAPRCFFPMEEDGKSGTWTPSQSWYGIFYMSPHTLVVAHFFALPSGSAFTAPRIAAG